MATRRATAAVAGSRRKMERRHVLYTEQHQQIRDTVRQYVEKAVNPRCLEWEERGAFPAKKLFRDMGRLGLFGVNKPREFGGLGLDFSYSVAVAEAMGASHAAAIPMAFCVQSDMATPALAEFGSAYLKGSFLRPSMQGDMVACIAVSEPHAGSDVAAITTAARACPTSDDLIINGKKMWITNGAQADWACVLVNTGSGQEIHKNKSLVCVRLDEKGVSRHAAFRKLGMQSSDTAEIVFDNVRVPRSHIIGEEGRGFVYQMMQFQDERMVCAAVLLEPLQRCIDLTIEYARERPLFGKTVLEQQSIQYKLAELQADLEAVRALLYRAVQERLLGNDVTPLASMAKLKAGRLARTVTDSCMQYWGGAGFLWENPVAQCHRDLRLHSIAAGCDEVMLAIISKQMGLA